jgi:transposase-like protein
MIDIDRLGRMKGEGKVLGRPRIPAAKERAIIASLEEGNGIIKTARLVKVGTGTVERVRKAWLEQGQQRFASSITPLPFTANLPRTVISRNKA